MPWALAGAVLIGVSLGLMGSGGSVITVPVLTFLVGQDEKVAIAGSLAIVGVISLVAAIPYARSRLVDYRSVLFFGAPGMLGAYLGAHFARHVSGTVQLAVFAVLMLVAAALMLRPFELRGAEGQSRRSIVKLGVEGVAVGAVTGFVGVGGGFLIVPALVLLGGLPMHRAIGTSLFIIALKSCAGFYEYLNVLEELELHVDWRILGIFSTVGIAGSFVGRAVNTRLPQKTLRKAFACFLFLIGTFTVLESWSELLGPDASDSALIQGG